MLLRPTFRFSGENFWLRKICFIIISLIFVSINIYAQSGAWHNISTLPKGGGSACTLDGKIYIIGGSLPGSLTDEDYNLVFDPQTLTLEEKTPMPTPRGFLFTGVVNDTIYAIGGGYPTSTNKNEAYDPVTDTWTTKANMPFPWIGVYGAVANGKIYSIGGNYNRHECFEYNPVTNTWTQKTSIPNDGGGALSATEYNGLIYTFGGSTYSPWAALSTVYVYDPQADTWTKKGNMPTPRFALKTFLVNGKIYAIGGSQSQSTALSTVEVYDPVTDTWVQGQSMPINLAWLTGTVVNNKIYIIGGTSDFGNTGNYIVWEYDPTLDPIAQHGWTKKGQLPTGRAAASASVINNKIYVIGGSTAISISDLDNNEVYDPALNIWEVKTPMPTPRGFLFTGVVNDTIYAIGGGYPTSTNKNEAYDPVTDTWTTKANMPFPWIGVYGAVANGKIYSIGGNYNRHECFEYNPVTNTWTQKTSIPNDGGGALSATEYNGLIYTFGGSTYSPWAALSTVYVYDPQADTWTKKGNMPTPRFALKTFLVNGKIYAIGGSQSQSTALSTVEVYDPATDTWKARENMPYSIAWFAGAVVNNKIYIIGGTDNWSTGPGEIWEYDPTLDPTPVEPASFTAIENYKLEQNYPNPFNPGTVISYQLPVNGDVVLRVFDVLGNEVATLVDEYRDAGYHEVEFQSSVGSRQLASGIYFYQLRSGDYVAVKKMILLK